MEIWIGRLGAPQVPVLPLFIRGTGCSLPKRAIIPLPVSGEVQVGKPLTWIGDRRSFMAAIETEVARLVASEALVVYFRCGST